MITFGDATTAGSSAEVRTHSHTVDPGDNRVLLCGMSVISASGIQNPTYNDIPLTLWYSNGGGTSGLTRVYALINPPVGTYDFVSEHTASGFSSRWRAYGVHCAYGVHQAIPFGDFVEDSIIPGQEVTVNVATESDDIVWGTCRNDTSNNNGNDIFDKVDQARRWFQASGTGSTKNVTSTKPATGSTTTFGYTTESDFNMIVIAAALKPAKVFSTIKEDIFVVMHNPETNPGPLIIRAVR